MKNHVIVILFLFLLSQGLAAQTIPDFSANYKVMLNGLSAGELKRELSTTENGSRRFTSQTQAKGVFAFFKPDVITETSIWTQKGKEIRPESYLYTKTGGKKEKHLNFIFDWKTQHVNVANKEQTHSFDVTDNTLDKLVYQLAIMADLADNKKQLSYSIAGKHKLKIYDIAILGEEIISTPLGKVKAIKLKRKRDEKQQRQTTLWCAPELNYLPVKIEHIEKDGTNFTAELRKLKGIDIDQAFEKKVSASSQILAH